MEMTQERLTMQLWVGIFKKTKIPERPCAICNICTHFNNEPSTGHTRSAELLPAPENEETLEDSREIESNPQSGPSAPRGGRVTFRSLYGPPKSGPMADHWDYIEGWILST